MPDNFRHFLFLATPELNVIREDSLNAPQYFFGIKRLSYRSIFSAGSSFLTNEEAERSAPKNPTSLKVILSLFKYVPLALQNALGINFST